MSSDFLTPEDDLRRIAEEISALRRDLSAMKSALNRIEKRLKVAYSSYSQVLPEKSRKSISPPITSQKSREQLLGVYDSMVQMLKAEGDNAFERSIRALPDEDILALAQELGLGSISKLSLKKAKLGIRQRAQESSMLSFDPIRTQDKEVE